MRPSHGFYTSLFCVFLMTVSITIFISVSYDSSMITEFYWWDSISIKNGRIEIGIKKIHSLQGIKETLDRLGRHARTAAQSP